MGMLPLAIRPRLGERWVDDGNGKGVTVFYGVVEGICRACGCASCVDNRFLQVSFATLGLELQQASYD